MSLGLANVVMGTQCQLASVTSPDYMAHQISNCVSIRTCLTLFPHGTTLLVPDARPLGSEEDRRS